MPISSNPLQTTVQMWGLAITLRLRRYSFLLSAAWDDGLYLTAWPLAASILLPVSVALIGSFEGASHWSRYVVVEGGVSSGIRAIDFAQMVPLVVIAAIVGALSSRLGLVLVIGFALADFFFAASAFGPDRHGLVWRALHLYLPQFISYSAFFLLAVTPTITSKVMVVNLRRWFRNFGLLARLLLSTLACTVQGVSVYAWTLAAPMIVRTHWIWAGFNAPVAVDVYRRIFDPWLPVVAAAAMAARIGLSLKAKEKLDISSIINARRGLADADRISAAAQYPFWQEIGSALLITVLISGLFNSVLRGLLVFGVIAILLITRQTLWQNLQVWRRWSRLATQIPLILPWAATLVISFVVTRWILTIPSFSARANWVRGAFGAEILCFLVSLAIALILLPAPERFNSPPDAQEATHKGISALILTVCAFLLATRSAYASCLDPGCCFGADTFLAAILVVAMLLELLPIILIFADLGLLGELLSIYTIDASTDLQIGQLLSEVRAIRIAGSGTKTPLRVAQELAAIYGGEAKDWIKASTVDWELPSGIRVQFHYYFNEATNKIVEWKLKLL